MSGSAAVELGVDVGEVDDEPLVLFPVGPAIERERAGRLERGHALGVALARLLVEVLEVVAQLAHLLDRAQRAVTRDDRLRIEREDPLARGDPVRHGAGPRDRVRPGEEDVAGEQHPLGGHVHERVAARVRRADLDQLQLALAHAAGSARR